MMTETFAPARFNFALPAAATRVRAAWISDVHLGTRAAVLPDCSISCANTISELGGDRIVARPRGPAIAKTVAIT